MSKLKISNVVRSQLPEFIQSDESYDNFKVFLEAYYEFLDQQETRSIESIRDIDSSLEDFVDQFRKEFNYNNTYSGNEALFLRNIKQLYSSKGSEASYKLLFRLLFNKNVELVYPGDFMLIPSHGKWIQGTAIFISVTSGNALSVEGKEINLVTDDKTIKLFVERVKLISGTTYQFFINKNYYGTIPVGGTIDSELVSGTVLPTTSKISVSESGTGFTIGQLFTITDGVGTGTKIKILNVDEDGAVISAQIIQFGLGYTESFEATLDGDTDCALSVTVGAVAKYPGYFSNNDGFISDAIYIQDSRYFQSYSYVIKIDEQLESYKNIVRKYIHPAGFAMFGEYTINNIFSLNLTLETDIS